MCLLIVKPRGIEMPSENILKRAHLVNPDGCGFASTRTNCKTMDFNYFMRKLKTVGKDEACIIHFRWATNGSVRRSNCHPFNDGKVWFAHNGVLSYPAKDDMTDSETAFRELFVPVIREHGIFGDELYDEVDKVIGTSKFAFLKGKAVVMFGNFTELGGCWFSNLRGLQTPWHLSY